MLACTCIGKQTKDMIHNIGGPPVVQIYLLVDLFLGARLDSK